MDAVGKVNILIVDDRRDKLLSFEVLLGELGENVLKASSGKEALRLVLRHEFAVILLDINMPGMDGFETAQLIRARKGSRQTPIIFLTAFADDLHVERSYEHGAVDFILTPAPTGVLKAKVAVFVDLFRKTEQVKRQADSLRRRAKQLHKLTRASLSISAASSLDGMLKAIIDEARDIIGTNASVLTANLGPGAGGSRRIVSLSEGAEAEESFLAAASVGLGEILRVRSGPLRMTRQELDAHPEWLESSGEERGRNEGQVPHVSRPMGAGGFLAVPLTSPDGRNLGFIQLTDKVEGDFDDEDEAIMVQLAQLASIALRNWLHAEEREANRLKDEFLATLSHELRTPLTAILGWARILHAKPPDAAQLARGLGIIVRNVESQTKLIEDLLDISRITSGKLCLETCPLSLATLVEATVDAQRPAAEAKQISLELKLDRATGLVEGDGPRLQQAVSNLLTNALKFTPKGGRVEVLLRRSGDTFELVVRDSGVGISKAFLPFVFERYRQAESGSSRPNSGLGIGLAIVRRVVELHGGSVRAESPGKDQGTVLTLTCPAISTPAGSRKDVVEPEASEAEVAPAVRSLEGIRVLVVDNDIDGREMMEEVMLAHRASVLLAASAEEALDAIGAFCPDVLLSDMAMPGTSGLDLVRAIRQREPANGGNTPALAVTAHAHRDDRARALAAGFDMHVAKPIDPETLVNAVASLIAVRQTRP